VKEILATFLMAVKKLVENSFFVCVIVERDDLFGFSVLRKIN